MNTITRASATSHKRRANMTDKETKKIDTKIINRILQEAEPEKVELIKIFVKSYLGE